MDKALFNHTTQIRVRNYEIDWQGIVHNAVYLQYFEVGRIAYLEQLGLPIDLNSIQHGSRIVVARNEINYRTPARFGEILTVSTRVSYIRNTSFAFEGILEEPQSGRRVAENVCIHVWLDPNGGGPIPVKDDFRKLVSEFEGEHVKMGQDTLPRDI